MVHEIFRKMFTAIIINICLNVKRDAIEVDGVYGIGYHVYILPHLFEDAVLKNLGSVQTGKFRPNIFHAFRANEWGI